MQNKLFIRIAGFGHYLPKKRVYNSELPTTLNTSDEWISTRTGIKQRNIANSDESSETLALAAVKQLLEKNKELRGLSPDLIITASSTPSRYLPSCSSFVSSQCFSGESMAFDINSACSGFTYAIDIAHSLMQAHQFNHALIIGSDTMSRVVDWSDRNTCVLFGDGAGCLWLKKDDKPGILACHSSGNASFYHKLYAKSGYCSIEDHKLSMDGSDVFKFSVKQFSEMAQTALAKANKSIDDLSYLITHQANLRIIQAVAKQVGIAMEKVIVTVDEHANTSAASLPLAMSVAHDKQCFKTGDLIMLLGFGAGYTWSSVLLNY